MYYVIMYIFSCKMIAYYLSDIMTDSFPERSTMVLTHLPSLSQSTEANWSVDGTAMHDYCIK